MIIGFFDEMGGEIMVGSGICEGLMEEAGFEMGG